MHTLDTVGLLLAIALLIYLGYALLRAEKF